MGSKVQVADAGRGESWKQPLCSGLRVAAQTGHQKPVPSWISTFHRNLSMCSEPSLAGKYLLTCRDHPLSAWAGLTAKGRHWSLNIWKGQL